MGHNFISAMAPHPDKSTLYWRTQYSNNSTSQIHSGILATDYDMNVLRMNAISGDPANTNGIAIPEPGNFLYYVEVGYPYFVEITIPSVSVQNMHKFSPAAFTFPWHKDFLIKSHKQDVYATWKIPTDIVSV